MEISRCPKCNKIVYYRPYYGYMDRIDKWCRNKFDTNHSKLKYSENVKHQCNRGRKR